MLQIKKSSLIVFIFGCVLFLSNTSISGQRFEHKIVSLDKKSIENLKTGIKSDNPGLRRSSICFAGKYSVSELSETLLEQLEVEDDPNFRILLVRVLFIIDDQKYMDEIFNLAIHDHHPRVRKMASAVYTIMNIHDSHSIIENQK